MMNSVVRFATSRLAPAGSQSRLTIITFHRVLETIDLLQPDLPTRFEFEKKLDWLASQFTILPLSQACDLLFQGSLPSRAASITFDDGYRDNLSNALPSLRQRNLPCTLFVATGFQAGNNMFNDSVIESVRVTLRQEINAEEFGGGVLPLRSIYDRRSTAHWFINAFKYLTLSRRELALQKLYGLLGTRPNISLMLSSEELRELHAHGVELGGHTRNHPILLKETDENAFREIQSSYEDLSDLLDQKIRLFAFPNGKENDDFSIKHCEMAKKAGFDYAFTTDPGSARANSNPFKLPRVAMWANSHLRNNISLLRNLR